MEKTIGYLQEKMGQFLRKGDRVIICFSNEKETDLGSLFAKAVDACGAVPIHWGDDHRWKSLLRLVFGFRGCTLVAPPLVILGLSKLARATATPLNISNAVMAGYPCTDWMIRGIRSGLDCKSWGCFDVEHPSVVAGFSCPQGVGVHVNRGVFRALICDEWDQPVSFGKQGAVLLEDVKNGSILRTYNRGRISDTPCGCGSADPLLLDLSLRNNVDHELLALSNSINRWTSVLDCRIQRGENGLEIEIVAFPGEKLPKLPTCAKLVVRPWDSEVDAPFEVNVQKRL